MLRRSSSLSGILTVAALLWAPRALGETQAIYGGAKVKPCAWPTTVALGGCTGTLVHPQVIVFAAHCGGASSAVFGDNENSPAFEVPTAGCKTDPQYGSQGGHDVAYCKLAKPVTQVPIVPILMGCETQALKAGADVVAVGFGEANDGLGWGPKREVAMKLNGITDGEANIGGNGKDTCYGDSGGPVYIRLGDGSWRVFGITSYGEYCGSGGYYSMMHTDMAWLEQSSGIDLTPCHDSQGNWAPGPGCGGFPMEPGMGGGSWSQSCAGGPASGASATCGAPYGGPTGSGGGGGGGTGGIAGGSGGGSSGGWGGGSSGGWGGGSGGSGAGGSGDGGCGGWGAGSNGDGGWGGDGGFGDGPGNGGSGAIGGGSNTGGSGAQAGALPACAVGGDCELCSECVDRCTCMTGDAPACQTACAPYGEGNQGQVGGASGVPPVSADDAAVEAGCACSLGETSSDPRALLWMLALALGIMRRKLSLKISRGIS